MLTFLASARRRIARFRRDPDASMSLETVLVFPLLIWGVFGMFILFEGYRALSSNVRAAHTIGDMLSRETNTVTPGYIEGLNDILDVLTTSNHRTVLRVTVVRYDEQTDDHILEWSYATDANGIDAVTDGTLDTIIVPHLPPMPDEGVLAVVETWVAFEPFMNITLKPFYFEQRTITRPRFAGRIDWDPNG